MSDAACRMTEGPSFHLIRSIMPPEINICSLHFDVLCMSKALPNYREKTLAIFILGRKPPIVCPFCG